MRPIRSTTVGLCLGLALAWAAAAAGQEEGRAPAAPSPEEAAMMAAWQKAMTPGPEHRALAAKAGTWSMTTKVFGPPGSEPQVGHGTAERTLELDGRVLHEQVTAELAGAPLSGIGRTGYDNVTGRYWSTWTDNMSTAISVLWGSWGEDGGVLEGELSQPMTGQRAPMRIEITMQGPDKQIEEFYMPGPGGGLIKTMEVIYERK
jgi:hypothetical protein